MTRLFSPVDALAHVIGSLTPSPLAREIAELLVDNDDAVYTTVALPHGFKVKVSIRPNPEPVVVLGITLIRDTAYDIKYEDPYRRGKAKSFHGLIFEGGSGWSDSIMFRYPSHMRRHLQVRHITKIAPVPA